MFSEIKVKLKSRPKRSALFSRQKLSAKVTI